MQHRSICSLCEAHCGVLVEVEGDQVRGVRGDPDDPLSHGYICPKGLALKDLYDDRDRVTQPMRRTRSGDWEEIGWEEALQEAAERLHRVRAAHGKNALAIYLGNPTVHNYTATLMGLTFLRAVRTRSRFSATSADQLPHMFAALKMFGHQLLLPVPDLDRCDFLVVLGGNPCASNGSIMTAPDVMGRIKAIKQRGRVLVIDPRRTETARLAGEYLPILPGRDPLLLLALLHVMFAEDLVDSGAWRFYSQGLEAVQAAVAPWSPQRVAGALGMEAAAIAQLARDFCASPRAALYGRLGTCTQRYGGLNAWLLNLINLLSGNLDRPGGMMFTQPAIDLVAVTAKMGHKGGFARYKSRVSGLPEFGGELPVSVMAEEIETPGPGQIRALLTVAGNPVLSIPNGRRLEKALPGLDYMVSLDHYLSETSRHANLILPPLATLERDAYSLVFNMLAVRNIARFNNAPLKAPEGARDDWQTMLEIGARMLRLTGAEGTLRSWGLDALRRFGPRRMLDVMLRSGPYGAGVPLLGPLANRLRGKKPGLSLQHLLDNPEGVDLGALQPCLPERLFTADKQIQLAPQELLDDLLRVPELLEPMVAGELLLIGRRHLRSNNSWLHNSVRLMKGKPRHGLKMHPDDARKRGLEEGRLVRISSRVGSVEAPLETDADMMPGVVSLPHGWGHTRKGIRLSVASAQPGASINDITDEQHYDPLTGTAGFSGVPVEVAGLGALQAVEVGGEAASKS